MKTALYFEELQDNRVQCHLCPHNCFVEEGKRGDCGVRKNIDARLVSENFGFISSIQSDPVEKKPLYHFYPGRQVLSIGSIGCNFSCSFCQNCEISQATQDSFEGGWFYSPAEIVDMALKIPDNIGVAYTYNEPVVYYEFTLETAMLIHERGLKNIVVSNGYINQEPLRQILPFIDAFNVDLKAFTDHFYKSVTKGHLRSVKNTLIEIRKSAKHLEITNLLIPSLNDDVHHFRDMVKWIRDELGKDTVLHLSRYFPAFKSDIPKTSLNLLFNFFESAKKHLNYVYLGNVTGSESQNTMCGNCGRIVISRNGYFIQKNGIDESGRCTHCKNQIVVS